MVKVVPAAFARVQSMGAYDTGVREDLITCEDPAALEPRLGED